MLTLNNVKISLQNFGTIYGIFLNGTSKEAIEQRYYSFYNHEATGGDLEWWSETCGLFWIYTSKAGTADDKLRLALARAAFAKIMQHNRPAGIDPWPLACELAEKWYNAIDHVTWFKSESVWDMFDMGDSVTAEKGTGNFDDDVLGAVVSRAGNDALDANKQSKELDELDEEEVVS